MNKLLRGYRQNRIKIIVCSYILISLINYYMSDPLNCKLQDSSNYILNYILRSGIWLTFLKEIFNLAIYNFSLSIFSNIILAVP